MPSSLHFSIRTRSPVRDTFNVWNVPRRAFLNSVNKSYAPLTASIILRRRLANTIRTKCSANQIFSMHCKELLFLEVTPAIYCLKGSMEKSKNELLFYWKQQIITNTNVLSKYKYTCVNWKLINKNPFYTIMCFDDIVIPLLRCFIILERIQTNISLSSLGIWGKTLFSYPRVEERVGYLLPATYRSILRDLPPLNI